MTCTYIDLEVKIIFSSAVIATSCGNDGNLVVKTGDCSKSVCKM